MFWFWILNVSILLAASCDGDAKETPDLTPTSVGPTATPTPARTLMPTPAATLATTPTPTPGQTPTPTPTQGETVAPTPTVVSTPRAIGGQVGNQAPAFTLTLADGTTATLNSLVTPGKSLLLYFFATW